MPGEEKLPRRYVAIRRYDGKTCQPVSAVVWNSIPGREDDDNEVWLTYVRPIVRLSQKQQEEGHLYSLIGAVHAALEGAGLLSRAQRFISQAYYLGSYEEVLGLAMKEYVEVIR
jgi:hypothetical protein